MWIFVWLLIVRWIAWLITERTEIVRFLRRTKEYPFLLSWTNVILLLAWVSFDMTILRSCYLLLRFIVIFEKPRLFVIIIVIAKSRHIAGILCVLDVFFRLAALHKTLKVVLVDRTVLFILQRILTIHIFSLLIEGHIVID